MMKIEIRPQRVSDAKKFLEILSNPHFIYFPAKPKTLEEEKSFLRLNREKRKNNVEFNFSIIYDGSLVGGIGIRIDQVRPYIGEIGFFIDESYWGKGIATSAVKRLEAFISSNLKIYRLITIMAKENKASEKAVIKSGFQKEGVLKKALLVEDRWYDCYLYAKIL